MPRTDKLTNRIQALATSGSHSLVRPPAQSNSKVFTDPKIPASHIRALRSSGKRTIFNTMSPAKRSEFIRDCVAVKDDVSKLLKLGWGMYTEDLAQLKRAHAHALIEYNLYLEDLQKTSAKVRRENAKREKEQKEQKEQKSAESPAAVPVVEPAIAPSATSSPEPLSEPPVIQAPAGVPVQAPAAPAYVLTPEIHKPNLRLQKTREEIHASIMARLERQNERRERWMQQIESEEKPEWKALTGLDRNTLEQLKLESAIHGLMNNVAAPKVIAIAVSSSAGNDRAALLQGRDTRELSAGAQLALKGVGISRSAQEIRALGQDLNVEKAPIDTDDAPVPPGGAPKTLETPDRVAFFTGFTPQQLHEEFPEDSGEVQIVQKALGKGRFLEAVDVKVDFEAEDSNI